MKTKPFQALAACVLFLCLIALLNQCSSPYLHVEDYPASFAVARNGIQIGKFETTHYPVRLLPTDMDGWQFSNCTLWKSSKGMRIAIVGCKAERLLKRPECPQYRQLRFLK